MPLSVLPLKSTLKKGEFDLFQSIMTDIRSSKLELKDGDVIVISSKYMANSQGRVLEYNRIIPTDDANRIGVQFNLKPKMAEIILRESDKIFGGIPGFVLTSSDNILAPNAGIDKSNIENGRVVLYPNDPYLAAEQLKRKFFLLHNIHVGIIIADSRLMPGRVGTVGIAIASAGIKPTTDLRGEKDLHGNALKVTFQAVADDLATIANLKMGEGADTIPCVIIRDSEVTLTDERTKEDEMAIDYRHCVYVRGLGTTI